MTFRWVADVCQVVAAITIFCAARVTEAEAERSSFAVVRVIVMVATASVAGRHTRLSTASLNCSMCVCVRLDYTLFYIHVHTEKINISSKSNSMHKIILCMLACLHVHDVLASQLVALVTRLHGLYTLVSILLAHHV